MTPKRLTWSSGNRHDRDDAGAAVCVGHLLHARQHLVVGHQHVAQQHVERLVAPSSRARTAPHAPSPAPRPGTRSSRCSCPRAPLRRHTHPSRGRATAPQAPGSARSAPRWPFFSRLLMMTTSSASEREALLHHVLDGRSVDYQQHFLRLRLRGGQEARAEAGSGNESLHGHTFLCNVREAPQKRRFVHGVRLL